MSSPYDQGDWPCRLAWGRRGARAAAARGDVLVVVDVLSFSTSTAYAVEQGAEVFPCAPDGDSQALAARVGGHAAVHRDEVPERGRFSLSPACYQELEPGTRIVLPSPNGSLCTRLGADVPLLLVGALVNAAAVAKAARSALEAGRQVTVLACGERWEDGTLRVALEDYLGAGAILAGLDGSCSPEAQAAVAAFGDASDRLEHTLNGCGSGRELVERGYGEDVRLAARLNACGAAPTLQDDRVVALH